jgi:hypothetical protein
MNNIYPYEQQIKEALQDIQGDHMSQDWEAMKALLDEEKPERRGWMLLPWQKGAVIGILCAVLLGATWWSAQYQKNMDRQTIEAHDPTQTLSPETNNPTKKAASDWSARQQSTVATDQHIEPIQAPGQENEDAGQPAESLINQNETAIIKEIPSGKTNQKAIKKEAKGHHTPSGWLNPTDAYATNKKTKAYPQQNDGAAFANAKDPSEFSPTKDASNPQGLNKTPTSQQKERQPAYAVSPDINRQESFTQIDTDDAIEGKIKGSQSLKGYKIPVEVVGRKERKELKRSFKSISAPALGSQVSFAAGLLIPTNISIAQQQRPGLNINANNTMVTDYIPAAFLQYHIHPKLFIHSEFQFQSPQLTDRLLMSQSTQSVSPNSQIQNNVFVEKLYYFNLPLSIHYSPIRNFYVGTGMQFSSLISGVAGYESTRIENGTGVSSQYEAKRFQDDSISNALRSGDFRWQMDMNYYLNRFTFGARYNRALNNLVDIQVGNTRTQARNQNLQFYIRYNLWEEKR